MCSTRIRLNKHFTNKPNLTHFSNVFKRALKNIFAQGFLNFCSIRTPDEEIFQTADYLINKISITPKRHGPPMGCRL